MRRLLPTLLLLGCAGAPRPIAEPSLDRAAIDALLRKDDKRADLWRDLGWADYLAARTADAEKAFRRAAKLAPADSRALLGLATVEHEAGRQAAARDLWTAILERSDPQADRWAPAVQEMAAGKMQVLAGEVPGEREWSARLARLDASRLTPEARARWIALRAQLARRLGDEAEGARLDEQRACPPRWSVSGPFGALPRLDLARPFPADGNHRYQKMPAGRAVDSRGCAVTVERPGAGAGVMYLTTWVQAEAADRFPVVVSSDQPWRLLVDGVAVWREEDALRHPPRTRALDVPLEAGWHRLSLKLAMPGPRAEVTVHMDPTLRFSDVEPGPLAEPPVADSARPAASTIPEAGDGTHARLADYLVAQAAARDGDMDRGMAAVERLLTAAPRFVPGILLAAQLATEDPSRPARFARDLARRLLERALGIDAAAQRARYNLALMDLQEDHPEKALGRLDEKPRSGPAPVETWRAHMLRYQAYHARRWPAEAEEALAAARRANPEACPPLEAEVAVARDHHDVARARRLAADLVRCDPASDDLAEVLREAGEHAASAAEYRRLLGIEPTRESWRSALGDVLAAAGEPRRAIVVLEALVADQPRTASYRRQLADLLVATGDAARARAVLWAGLAEAPESNDLHRALTALGEGHVLDPYRLDGRQAIAEFEKQGLPYDGPAVLVLDRTVMRVFPTGARMTLTHNIIRVLTKEGIEKWGEVRVPDDADLLLLRTVKADGTTREPEDIAEKKAISAPDLEPGDYVEFEYVDRAAPPAAFPGGFLGERFYFGTYDAPLDRTEFVLVVPPAMPLVVDRRGSAPEPRESARDDHGQRVKILTWADRHRPQQVTEPQQTPFVEYVASVRPSSGVTLLGWRDYVRDQTFGTLRANPEIRDLARRLTAGLDRRGKVVALERWVRHHVKGGGSVTEPATTVLARGEGNRGTLLRALLAAVDIPSEAWLVRQATAAHLDGPQPDIEGLDQMVVAIPPEDGKGPPMVVDPRYRHGPAGFLNPAVRGQRALALDGSPTLRWTPLPEGDDQRLVELDATLDAGGGGEVRAKETLTGWPAVEWREALERMVPDRLRQEIEQRTLGYFFPGATLSDVQIGARADDDQPLVVTYSFKAPRIARAEEGKLVLPAPYPALLRRRYVGIARRTTPLQLLHSARTVVRATYRLPPGAKAAAAPPSKVTGFGEFERRATVEGSTLRLESRGFVPIARVPADRYPDLVRFAEAVDDAEARVADVTLP